LQGGTIEGKGKFFRNWQKIIPVQAGEMGHPIEITIEINRKTRQNRDETRDGSLSRSTESVCGQRMIEDAAGQ
jgi:hypothetical protein